MNVPPVADPPAPNAPPLDDMLGGPRPSGNGGTKPNLQPSSDDGNGDEPPIAGQQGDANKAPDGQATPPAGPDDASTDADIEAAARKKLGLKGAGDGGVDFFKTKYAESSKEAKELKAQNKAIETRLAKMGLKIARNAQGEHEFVADDKYVADRSEEVLTEVAKSLTKEDREAAVDDPDGLIAKIVRRTIKRVAAPAPTMRQDQIRISEQESSDVHAKLLAEKDDEGRPKYEGMAHPMVEQFMSEILDDPSTPDEVRAVAMRTPEAHAWMLRALHAMALLPLQPAIRRSEAQKKAAEERKRLALKDPSLAPDGALPGSTATPKGKWNPKAEADEIIGARRW